MAEELHALWLHRVNPVKTNVLWTLTATAPSSLAQPTVKHGTIVFGLRLQHRVAGVQLVHVPCHVRLETATALLTSIASDRLRRVRTPVSTGVKGCGWRVWLAVVGVRRARAH